MELISIKEISTACGGKFFGPPEVAGQKTTAIKIDSRKIEAGDVFIAVIGQNLDGHNYIDSACKNGALCVISERAVDGRPHILVGSTLQAIKDIAEHYRKKFDIPVIGITGSVGTIKEMVYHVLSSKYSVLKTRGNLNNEFGLPQMVFDLNFKHDVAVLEMGMNNFGEISRLSKVARPDIAVISNIGEAHIGNLGSRDGILKAKCEIFDYMNKDGRVFLNGDDDKLVSLRGSDFNAVFFGINKSNDIFVKQILGADENGTRLIACYYDEQIEIYIPKAGEYMIYPALVALGIAKSLSLTNEQIVDGIGSYEGVGSRNKIIKTERLTIVDDVYNACKASIIAGVNTLKDMKTDGKKVAIIGDVFELGEFSEKIHFEIGQALTHLDVDIVICVGKDAYFIDKAIRLESDKKSMHYESQDEMLLELASFIDDDDIVYVKASRDMAFENTVSYLENL